MSCSSVLPVRWTISKPRSTPLTDNDRRRGDKDGCRHYGIENGLSTRRFSNNDLTFTDIRSTQRTINSEGITQVLKIVLADCNRNLVRRGGNEFVSTATSILLLLTSHPGCRCRRMARLTPLPQVNVARFSWPQTPNSSDFISVRHWKATGAGTRRRRTWRLRRCHHSGVSRCLS